MIERPNSEVHEIRRLFRKVLYRLKSKMEESRYHNISKYNIRGFKRIYLLHIRKAGGTSLNQMFLSLSGEDPSLLYDRLVEVPDHRLLSNGRVYVGWNAKYINRGNYFYAFSHTPLHKLNLPIGTFTLACFRDPVSRVIAHYNMLMAYAVNKVAHPCMKTEGRWLGNSFEDFIKRIPQEHLCNQLYMFSGKYNVDEAVGNVQSLSHYIFSHHFDDGVDSLNKKTGLNLRIIHTRKTSYKAEISESSIASLREKLDKEYIFMDRIIKLQNP